MLNLNDLALFVAAVEQGGFAAGGRHLGLPRSTLSKRVALLEGLSVEALEATWAKTHLMPGARSLVRTMAANGAHCALASGGFTWFTARVAALCGFTTHHANILLDDGRHLLGRVEEPVFDRDAKLVILTRLATGNGLAMSETLAVGDGANDLLGLTLEPNVFIQNSKIGACDIQPGRRPRGEARVEMLKEYQKRAHLNLDSGNDLLTVDDSFTYNPEPQQPADADEHGEKGEESEEGK